MYDINPPPLFSSGVIVSKTDDADEPVYHLRDTASAPTAPVDDIGGDVGLGEMSALAGWGNFPSSENLNNDRDAYHGLMDDKHLRPTETPQTKEPILSEEVVLVSETLVEAVSPQMSYQAATPQAVATQPNTRVQDIPVDKIAPNPFQPRKFFEPAALKELADSIREHGVIQPIVVTVAPNGYEIVVGERRFRASVMAGMKFVPAIVKESMGDQTKLEVALIENIQRHELNPIEEAIAYDRLLKSFGMTQEQIAKKLGKARPTITNTLRLLNLPAEIQRAIIDGKLAEGHARPLLSITDRMQQLALFKEILEKGLNTRQIETKARELVSRRSLDGLAPDPKLLALESALRGQLGTQVKIQRQGRGGKITIDFFSEEELESIINLMATKNNTSRGSGDEYITV